MGRKDKDVSLNDMSASQQGTQMRQARQEKNISLTDMAARLSYTKSHLSSVENNVARPSPTLVEQYERELGLARGSLSRNTESIRSARPRRVPPTRTVREQTSKNNAQALSEEHQVAEATLSYKPSSNTIHHFIDHKDLGETPHIEHFYGRKEELAELVQWIVDDKCRAVTLLGMGGIGKTALASTLVEHIKDSFDYVLWRSLRNAPPLKDILEKCIVFLSDEQQTDIPENIDDQLSLLITYLRKCRCLLVLDNFESVLQEGKSAGLYQEKDKEYGKLLLRLGELEHQSCLLLTSREKPAEIVRLEGKTLPVRSMELPGIRQAEGYEMLKEEGISGSDNSWKEFITLYNGNPLALKLAAEPIRELFQGDIAAFLQEKETVVGDVYELLSKQFHRLSPVEKEILYWLAIEREAITLEDLRAVVAHAVSKSDLLEALQSLRRRSMIEISGTARFTLQAVIMEYLTDDFVKRVYENIMLGKMKEFADHALIKALGKDYVRESQRRLILIPVVERLIATLGESGTINKLKNLLAKLHTEPVQKPGYAAGNILNLLIHLKADLRHCDFSHLTVWQAYLQGVVLQDVNFSYANVEKSVFSDAFGSILSVACSADGKTLAVGTVNCEVQLWNMSDGIPTVTLQGHTDWVRSVAFSPDGTLLASSSEDQTVRLWEVGTGQCIDVLREHTGRVYTVAFSPDGTLLASSSEDQTVRLWEVGTGQCIDVLREHTDRVWAVAFSPDGKLLATGSEDRTIRLWRVSDRKCLHILRGHISRIWSVAFSPNAQLLASSSEDQTVRLWEVSTGQHRILTGHTNWVRSVVFSPDGTTLASGGEDRMIRLWEVSTGRCFNILQGHENRVRSLVYTSDGRFLISGGEDQAVRIWEASTGRPLRTIQGYITRIWAVAFSPDGRSLATSSEDQTIRLWDASTGRLLRVFTGHTNWVRSVAFSPDGTTLASGGEDQIVRIWEVSTGRCLSILPGHTAWIYGVTFSPNGTLLASSSEDQTVRLWEASTGRSLSVLKGHTNWVRSVAFSPDGKFLASGGEDQTVRLWEVSTGRSLSVLKGHSDGICSVAFNADGTILASGSEDHTVRLWETSTRQFLTTLQDHSSRVRSIAFSPDGKFLASGGDDQTVRLWETNTWSCIQVLQKHRGRVCSLVFSPDSTTLVSGSYDGTAKFWAIPSGVYTRTVGSDRPYERMNITEIKGLVASKKDMLRALGAIEVVEDEVREESYGVPFS